MSEQIPNMDYNADEVIKGFKEKFGWAKPDEVQAIVKPKKLLLRLLLSLLATIIAGGIVYYNMLPAMNFKDSQMYIFIITLIVIFMAAFSFACRANKLIERKAYVKSKTKYPVAIIAVLVLIMVVGSVIGATIFRAGSYSRLMPVTDSKFSEDFKSISYDSVPRIDQDRALTLADQQLGSLAEYKSQYVVSNTTTMINYKGSPVRVAYLEYADAFKWFNNTKEGLPAYMIIDLVTQKVSVVNCKEKFGEGMKYSPTEWFNEQLYRHIRFQYPTAILDTPNFEINDEGRPYWITPVLDKTIGLFGGTDVKGAVITDALTGDSQYYSIEDVKSNAELQWIDVVYRDTLLLEQYNYYGKLQNGFWNSIIFQNDVNLASEGWGSLALNDDVWIYTGVTSSESDSSNFGFILCNQRTKETRYYQNGGAMENAAQRSAQDAVQNYGYKAVFPILLDIEGEPTYFMSLYGSSNTVKGYALVNLDDKTLVGTGLLDNTNKSDAQALNAAVENYIISLQDKGKIGNDVDLDDYIVEDEKPQTDNKNETKPTENGNTVKGKVSSIKTSVNNGNTVYYLEIGGKYYYISVADCMDVLLVNTGDTVTVTLGKKSNGVFIEATKVAK
ncbi:MAG: CvpA family protein [Eubacterium sp.]|nr:CvpA family protein [Eubacterium sp.]